LNDKAVGRVSAAEGTSPYHGTGPRVTRRDLAEGMAGYGAPADERRGNGLSNGAPNPPYHYRHAE